MFSECTYTVGRSTHDQGPNYNVDCQTFAQGYLAFSALGAPAHTSGSGIVSTCTNSTNNTCDNEKFGHMKPGYYVANGGNAIHSPFCNDEGIAAECCGLDFIN